jgi:hypothetical protein
MLWGALIHLGYNLYLDEDDSFPDVPYFTRAPEPYYRYSPDLMLDEGVWDEIVASAAGKGVNTIVLDLADGVRYESHPEIAVNGAWSVQRLKDEIARLRAQGITVLPKLNFSAGHDVWLKEYAKQVSTPAYYRVVDDLIDEVAEIFDRPELFHLGMDEETYENQQWFSHIVIRRGDLWWSDLQRMIDRVESNGSRAWVWADAAWHAPEEYLARMPRSVVQSNWYYEPVFTGDETGRPKPVSHDGQTAFLTYLDLDEHGFDQIPTASVFPPYDNLEQTVEFCTSRLDPARVLGFLHSTWVPPTRENRDLHLLMLDRIAEARARFEQSQ